MKRIIISAILIASAAMTAAYGSTGAFFSDTESSIGNVFTAGSVDLKIDHSLSSYNGGSVENDLIIVSDPQTQVDSHDAAIISDTPITTQYWTASSSPLLVDSSWIWSENPAANDAINNDVQKTFTRTFNWNGPVTSATLAIAADNRYSVSINGHNIDAGAGMASNDQHVAADSYVINAAWINQGSNVLTVVGQNDAQASPPDQANNPAGVRFRLEIHGQALNLDPIDLSGEPFWTFNDVKPADQGRDVFSLHVETNDAWACMEIGNVQNEENDRIEPEVSAGDTTDGPGNGELGQYLHLFLWHDLNHDGFYNPPTETNITPLSGIDFSGTPATTSVAVHDALSGNGPLPGGATDYVGSAWCAGALNVDGSGTITCDGSDAANPGINRSQTDSTTADLTFYATQSRNQPDFTCASLSQ